MMDISKLMTGLFTNKDYEFLNEWCKPLKEKYPHVNDAWNKTDVILKWGGLAYNIEQAGFDPKSTSALDIGVGYAWTPAILCPFFSKYIVIERESEFVMKLSQMLSDKCPDDCQKIECLCGDAFHCLGQLPNNSLDVAIDSCSVTHFDSNSDSVVGNSGVYRTGVELMRILKPGGYYFVVSDTMRNCHGGEFIEGATMISLYEKAGLKSLGKPAVYVEDTYILRNVHPVVSAVFQKPL